MVRGSAEPQRVVYGTTVISGVLVAVGSSGADNQYLHLVVALAGHQVEAINAVWLNDLPSTEPRFSGLVRVNKHLGADDQAADSDLVAEFAGWTSAHRLRGIAYVYVRLKWDANVWLAGLPNVKCEVQGKRIWDPRVTAKAVTSSSVANPTVVTATAHGFVAGDRVYISGHSGSIPKVDGEYQVLSAPTADTFTIDVNVTTGGTGGSAYKMAFSSNAALCQLDQAVSRLGIQAESAEVDTTVAIAAANICDEDITVNDFGLTRVWQVAAAGPTFVDETADANNPANADWQIFPTAEATGDYVAIGSPVRFSRLKFDNLNGTAGVGGVVAWEYWNGSAWAALAGISDATTGFTAAVADGRVLSFTLPVDWAPTSLNGTPALFYIRARVTTIYSTNPVYDQGFNAPATQDRYACDGVFDMDERPIDVIENLLTSSAGSMVYQQGKYSIQAGAYTVPTVTIDRDDLRGPIELTSKPGRRDLYNAMRGQFVDAANSYQPTDFSPVTSATYESQDGGIRLFREINLPFVTNAFRAQRIAKVFLERGRRAIACKFPANLRALELAAWDTVQVTVAQLGWASKVFRVVEWALAEDGGIDLSLKEEDANVYTWSAEETALSAAPATTLPNPFSVPTPSGLTLTSGGTTQFISPDGTVISRIKVAWTAPTDQFILSGGHAEVQSKKASDSVWLPGPQPPGNQNEAFVEPVLAGVNYDVRVRFINNADIAGGFSSVLSHAVSADATAPAVPTSVTITPGFQRNIVTWTNPSDTDLRVVEIWRSTTNDSSGAAKVGETHGAGFIDDKLANATIYYYWLKARDRTGNTSAFHATQFAGVSGTTLRVVEGDITDGEISVLVIASNDASITKPADGITIVVDAGNGTVSGSGGRCVIKGTAKFVSQSGASSAALRIYKGELTDNVLLESQLMRAAETQAGDWVVVSAQDASPGSSQKYILGLFKSNNDSAVVDHRRLDIVRLRR